MAKETIEPIVHSDLIDSSPLSFFSIALPIVTQVPDIETGMQLQRFLRKTKDTLGSIVPVSEMLTLQQPEVQQRILENLTDIRGGSLSGSIKLPDNQ